jgi:hypothetical protein
MVKGSLLAKTREAEARAATVWRRRRHANITDDDEGDDAAALARRVDRILRQPEPAPDPRQREITRYYPSIQMRENT